jgi:glycosyltransferase involved in cell wall biosynthesis
MPPSSPLPEIRLAGFLNSGLGIGETGRRIARCLQTAGVPVLTHAWEKHDVATVPFETSTAAPSGAGPGISLLSMNADQIPSFLHQAGPSFTDQKYVICVWFWELPELSPGMEEGFRQVDEVWVATPFIQQALLKRSGDVPVHLFPHPVEACSGSAAEGRKRFPLEDRFVFLFAFDYQSCAKRKNPSGVCEAFVRAFPEASGSGPLCVIKSINAALHPVDHALLKRRWASRPDILFLDDFLSPADRDLLCWRADACVSLHRSEGLGLTLLEGMAIGKPCIATDYSGNTAFMSPETAWPVPWQPVPVGRGSLHYEATQVWAEPDPAAAAAAMREVFEGGPEVARRAATGQESVLRQYHPVLCGKGMLGLLEKAATLKPRKKPPLPGRRTANEALKKVKELEDRIRQSTPSRWKLPSNLTATRNDMIQLAGAQRHALVQLSAALKFQDQQAKTRHQYLLRHNERLADQLEELIRSLPSGQPAGGAPHP